MVRRLSCELSVFLCGFVCSCGVLPCGAWWGAAMWWGSALKYSLLPPVVWQRRLVEMKQMASRPFSKVAILLAAPGDEDEESDEFADTTVILCCCRYKLLNYRSENSRGVLRLSSFHYRTLPLRAGKSSRYLSLDIFWKLVLPGCIPFALVCWGRVIRVVISRIAQKYSEAAIPLQTALPKTGFSTNTTRYTFHATVSTFTSGILRIQLSYVERLRFETARCETVVSAGYILLGILWGELYNTTWSSWKRNNTSSGVETIVDCMPLISQHPPASVAFQPFDAHPCAVSSVLVLLPTDENGHAPVGQGGICCASAIVTHAEGCSAHAHTGTRTPRKAIKHRIMRTCLT